MFAVILLTPTVLSHQLTDFLLSCYTFRYSWVHILSVDCCAHGEWNWFWKQLCVMSVGLQASICVSYAVITC